MLSRSSFNALLKTLEEPPEHVKFILATTDPQKLPVTVLSRCLQFHLKALSVTQIETQLKTILVSETVEYDNAAVTLLAKAARGSMRDSLSLTDQGIAQGKGKITLENIQQMLGGVDQNWVFKILIALIKQDSAQLMTLSLEIASYAPNYSRLLADLIQLLHQVAMVQIVESHFDLSPEHNQLLLKFSQAMSPDDVQLYYQIVLNGRKDLPYACDEQAAFDMVLLRLLAFKPVSSVVTNGSKEDLAEKSIHQVSEINLDVALPETQVNQSVLSESSQIPAENIKQTQQKELNQAVDLTEDVLDDSIKTIADEDVLGDNKDQQLAAEMADIETVAKHEFSEREQEPLTSVRKTIENNLMPESNELLTENDEIDNSFTENNNTIVSPNYNIENQHSDLPLPAEAISTPKTAVDSVLATRNMLRSRKKELENNAKKSNDATSRHDSKSSSQENETKITKQNGQRKDVPDLATISEQPFSVDVIDPAIIKSANQVDKWANMIDSMALGGRLRQLAIHATICDSSTDEVLILLLDQSTKHLKTDVAHQQLQTELSRLLSRPIIVELNIVEKTEADPYKIQSHINDKRYDYAVELLKEDEVVKALQSQFQAQLNEETITAR